MNILNPRIFKTDFNNLNFNHEKELFMIRKKWFDSKDPDFLDKLRFEESWYMNEYKCFLKIKEKQQNK